MPVPVFLRKSAPGGAPLVIDPATVPDLELRLDAAAITGISGGPPFGSPLPLWIDTSGHVGRDASQVVVAKQPNYINFDTGPSGEDFPAVFFNNANGDNMHGNLPPNMDVSNGGTYYLWMRTFGTPCGIDGMVPFTDETGGRPRLYWCDGTGSPHQSFRVGSGDLIGTHGYLPTPNEGFYSAVWVYNAPPVTGKLDIFLNRIEIGPAILNNNPAVFNDFWDYGSNGTGYWLGSIPFGNHHLRARIFELLWYSRGHDTTTRIGISNFLRRKWHFG